MVGSVAPARRTPDATARRATVVNALECRPAESIRRLSLDDAMLCDGSSVLWLDIDLRATEVNETCRPHAAADLTAQVSHLCSGFTFEMADDLLDADPWPKVERLDGGIRHVSALGVTANAPQDAERSKAGTLTFGLIEIVAGDGWLVTCRHRPQTHTGADANPTEGDLGSPETLYDEIDRIWQSGNLQTAGDLGVVLLQRAAESYKDARRQLFGWLDAWELGFYKRCDKADPKVERQTLIDLRALIYESRKCLTALNAPRSEVRDFWFADVHDVARAEAVDMVIDRVVASLGELSNAVRSAFDLVQLQLSQVQGRQTERLQQKFELITSIFLVPAVVAGFFGANTKFPGTNTAWGTDVMVVLMVVGSVLTYGLLALLRNRAERADHA